MELCLGLSQFWEIFVVERIQHSTRHVLMADTRIPRLLSPPELFQKFFNLSLMGWIRACQFGRLLLIWEVMSRLIIFHMGFFCRFFFLLSEVLQAFCFVCRWL